MNEELAVKLRALRTAGTLPSTVARQLDEYERSRAPIGDAKQLITQVRDKDRQSLIAALWLLGASHTQLAELFGVRRETIFSYVRAKISPALRKTTGAGRGGKRIVSTEKVNMYYATAIEKREAITGLDPMKMATRLSILTNGVDWHE